MRSIWLGFADQCERVTALLLTVLMGLMAVVGFYQVLSRFVLHEPSSWSEEVLRRTMIWMVAIGLSIGFRNGAHICVDVINSIRTTAIRRVIRWSVFGITLLFLLVLFILGCDMAWRVRFQTFASLELSMTWAYAAIPVGAAFSSIALVANFLVQPNVGSSKGELEDMSCQE